MKQKEFILCAAIYINDGFVHEEQPTNIETGFIVCGRRHNNCYQTFKIICEDLYNDMFDTMLCQLLPFKRKYITK